MFLFLEIGMLIGGIIALVRGQFALTKNCEVRGTTARIVGLVMVLPLPLAFGGGFLGGILLAVTRPGANIQDYQGIFALLDIGATLLCLVVAILIASFQGVPPGTPKEDFRDEDLDGFEQPARPLPPSRTIQPRPRPAPPPMAEPIATNEYQLAEDTGDEEPRRRFPWRWGIAGAGVFLFLLVGGIGTVLLMRSKSSSAPAPVAAEWKEHVSLDGRFRVQMPGQPVFTHPNDPQLITIVLHRAAVSTGVSKPAYQVVYFDYPPVVLQNQSPAFVLKETRDRFLAEVDGTILKDKDVGVEGHPGLDSELSVKKPSGGFVRVRHYQVDTRVYRVMVTVTPQARNELNGSDAEKFFSSFALLTNPQITPLPVDMPDDKDLFTSLRQAVAAKKYRTSDTRGGGDQPFQDVPAASLLIGFHYTLGKFGNQDVVRYLQPIYLTAKGEETGQAYGRPNGAEVKTVKAKADYAVGALRVRGGAGMDAIELTFMKIDGKRLNPADSYKSGQIGGNGGREGSFGGDGSFVVGIHGRIWTRDGGLGTSGSIGSLGIVTLTLK